MRRRILWILLMVCVVVWSIAAFLSGPLLSQLSADALPTLMVLGGQGSNLNLLFRVDLTDD